MPEYFSPFIKSTEIPSEFWSDLTHQPFENCISCEKYLLEEGTEYMIEKAMQSSGIEGVVSTIFEYAICLECASQLRSQLSKESLKNIDDFYAKRTNLDERRGRLMTNPSQVGEWIRHCIVDNRPYELGEEYQIYGQCIGKNFLYFDMPFMISGRAVEEIVGLISDKTMDELNNFKNNLTAGPPEFKALLESGGARVYI